MGVFWALCTEREAAVENACLLLGILQIVLARSAPTMPRPRHGSSKYQRLVKTSEICSRIACYSPNIAVTGMLISLWWPYLSTSYQQFCQDFAIGKFPIHEAKQTALRILSANDEMMLPRENLLRHLTL